MIKMVNIQAENNEKIVNQLLTGGVVLPTKKLNSINNINYERTNRNISIFS